MIDPLTTLRRAMQRRVLASTFVVAASFIPLVASAVDPGLTPYARVGEVHDTNIFAAPNPGPAVPEGAPTVVPDWRTDLIAGLDARGDFGQQRLTLKLEGRRFDYRRIKALTHNESLASGDFDFRVGETIDGALRASQEKRLEPFTQRTATTLQIETERKSYAGIRFKLTPNWSLQPNVSRRDQDSPQDQYPDLMLREDTVGAVLSYAGLGAVRMGLVAEHLNGRYTGAQQAVPNVSQTRTELTADYKVTGQSTLSAALGRTKRDQGLTANSQADMTGALSYRRQLTGKTSMNFALTRAVNSHVVAGNSEIDTGGSFGVEWLATARTSVTANYSRTRAVFFGDTLPGQDVPGRRDTMQSGQLSVAYQALRWLSIKPYVQRQSRGSNVAIQAFNDTLVGIEFIARPEAGAQ